MRPVEVLLADAAGNFSKTFLMPRRREGDALFVQFFIDCAYAILVPVGFCKKWNIRSQHHAVKLTSFAFLQKQKIS